MEAVGKVAVERSFPVAVSPERVWAGLAQVERWPEWAPHIKAVNVHPSGPLGPSSSGAFHIRRLGRSTFSMSVWDPPRRWEWTGGLPGLRVRYDHRFHAGPTGGDAGTTLTWVVTLSGPLAWLLSPVFARVYGRNLARAVPLLQEWFQAGHQAPGAQQGP